MTNLNDMRALRERLNMSQADLGEALGLNQSMISRMETGAIPINRRTRLALNALAMEADAERAAEADIDCTASVDTVSHPVQSWGKDGPNSREASAAANVQGAAA